MTDTNDTEDSSTTEGPFIPDVGGVADCYDDECPVGQWCGPAHNECRDIIELEACASDAEHQVVEVAGVVGTPVDVRVRDIDGDLDDDAIVLWDATPAVTVVLQDGGPMPLASQPIAVSGPLGVDIGDLDGDEIADLAVSTVGAVHWAHGVGDGTFGAMSELIVVNGAEIAGFGLARGGFDDVVNDVVVFVAEPSTLVMGINDGTGSIVNVLETALELETTGAFAATDRGFSDALALVGTAGVVHAYVPAKKTFVLEETDPDGITNADLPVIDVDIARSGGGVHTFGFVNLQGWTFGGYLNAAHGIPTPSRMVVGNGDGGFEYALVTEDDRVLVVDGCYDAHMLGSAPIAADAGDLDGDGRGDLAVAMDAVPLAFLLSGTP